MPPNQKNVFCICPSKRIGPFLKTCQKRREGQFLASELVSNRVFFEFFSKVFVNRGARVSLGSKSREPQRIFCTLYARAYKRSPQIKTPRITTRPLTQKLVRALHNFTQILPNEFLCFTST